MMSRPHKGLFCVLFVFAGVTLLSFLDIINPGESLHIYDPAAVIFASIQLRLDQVFTYCCAAVKQTPAFIQTVEPPQHR